MMDNLDADFLEKFTTFTEDDCTEVISMIFGELEESQRRFPERPLEGVFVSGIAYEDGKIYDFAIRVGPDDQKTTEANSYEIAMATYSSLKQELGRFCPRVAVSIKDTWTKIYPADMDPAKMKKPKDLPKEERSEALLLGIIPVDVDQRYIACIPYVRDEAGRVILTNKIRATKADSSSTPVPLDSLAFAAAAYFWQIYLEKETQTSTSELN